MKRTLLRVRRFDARSGQVIVLAAAAVVAMMLLAALVIDVGYIRFSRAQLQNTADAAAMAGALELVERRADAASEESARAAALTEAQAIADQNCGAARCQVFFGEYQDGQFAELDAATAATAVEVRMHRDGDAPEGALTLFFAPVAGVDTAAVHSSAVSQIARGIKTIRKCDLLPFAVHEDNVMPLGQTITIYDSKRPAPGNFGLLDFNGGLNATTELWDWILDGYDGEVSVPSIIDGDVGWRSALTSAVRERIGDTVVICVYNEAWEEGATAQFQIIRFLAVTLTQCTMTGNEKYIKARVALMKDVPYSEIGGPVDDNLCKIQLVS